MYVYVRLFKTLIRGLLAPRAVGLQDSVLHFRVWPNDLDFNLHMNNGRYLTLMDLGRMDLVTRLGMLPVMRRERWAPLLGNCTIRFRRSLAPFQKFCLRTRVVSWDDKWIYMIQRFETMDGKVAALALVRGLLAGPQGSITPAQMLAAVGITLDAPQMPIAATEWADVDDRLWAAYGTVETGDKKTAD